MKKPDEKFLQRLRALAGENLSEFARQIGMPQPMVYSYVKGQKVPCFEFFHRLSVKGHSLDKLFKSKTEIGTFIDRLIVHLNDLEEEELKEILEVGEFMAKQKRRARRR